MLTLFYNMMCFLFILVLQRLLSLVSYNTLYAVWVVLWINLQFIPFMYALYIIKFWDQRGACICKFLFMCRRVVVLVAALTY